MKRFQLWICALMVVMAAACSKDGEMLTATLPGENGITIGSAEREIVLEMDKASALVLSLYWDEMGDIVLSNPNAQIPESTVTHTLQFSGNEQFENPYEVVMATGATSVQYTTAQLNTIVSSRLGFEGGVASPLFIRMKSSIGANVAPRYGNAMQLLVTPYLIDMSKVAIRNKNGEDVAFIPAAGEGSYAGLANIPGSWLNFYFIEGDGTAWGTLNDGSNGQAFLLGETTDLTSWNCWFPEHMGCYYVTMTTTATAEWTATAIASLALQPSGIDAQTFRYNKTENVWYSVFTTTTDNAAIRLVQEGARFNHNTGDNKDNALATTLSLVADGNRFTVVDGEQPSGITAGAAGTYTLILNQIDQTWLLAEGEVSVGGNEEESPWPADPTYSVPTGDAVYIYSLGDQDVPNAVVGTLPKTADGVYGGFFHFNAWHNFKFGDTDDPATAKIYGSAPVPDGLYRLYTGADMWNIWEPDGNAGYYYITADFVERTWSFEPVTIAVVGEFNNWSLESDPMEYKPATKQWTATISAENWGAGFYMIVNGDWNRCYTDPQLDGTLEFSASSGGKEFNPSLEAGKSYKLTVDLNDPYAMSYTIAEVGDEPEGPTYPELLYAHYAWRSKWSVEVAATLRPVDDQPGSYTGYLSTAPTWDSEEYTNFVFSTSTGLNDGSGTVYGSLPDAQFTLDDSPSSNSIWCTDLGLNHVTVNLADMTWSTEQLTIAVSGTFNEWSLATHPMVFDMESKSWQATCTITGEDRGIQIVLGDWKATFGGENGSLVAGDAQTKIWVAEEGTYLIRVDLRDATNLTYTLTKQE